MNGRPWSELELLALLNKPASMTYEEMAKTMLRTASSLRSMAKKMRAVERVGAETFHAGFKDRVQTPIPAQEHADAHRAWQACIVPVYAAGNLSARIGA